MTTTYIREEIAHGTGWSLVAWKPVALPTTPKETAPMARVTHREKIK